LLNDRFVSPRAIPETDLPHPTPRSAPQRDGDRPPFLRRLAACGLMALGAWMVVSPQAVLGLNHLKWMHNYAFPGEVVAGVLVMSVSLYLLNPKHVA
jgi:hypothetical protein